MTDHSLYIFPSMYTLIFKCSNVSYPVTPISVLHNARCCVDISNTIGLLIMTEGIVHLHGMIGKYIPDSIHTEGLIGDIQIGSKVAVDRNMYLGRVRIWSQTCRCIVTLGYS